MNNMEMMGRRIKIEIPRNQSDEQQAERHGEQHPPADEFERGNVMDQPQVERQQPPDQVCTQRIGQAALRAGRGCV